MIHRFLRVFGWCRLVLGLALLAFIWHLGMRGEPVDWTAPPTWAALAFGSAGAALFSALPAAFLALLLVAARSRSRIRPTRS